LCAGNASQWKEVEIPGTDGLVHLTNPECHNMALTWINGELELVPLTPGLMSARWKINLKKAPQAPPQVESSLPLGWRTTTPKQQRQRGREAEAACSSLCLLGLPPTFPVGEPPSRGPTSRAAPEASAPEGAVPAHALPPSLQSRLVLVKALTPALARQVQVRHDILQSPNDDRKYAHIRLTNGLEAVVVSEPDADKAGAAMCVDVGYWSDPVELPGLAHFLEHMLFLGTDKYPDEAEYGKYITENNGTNNAYTSDIYTNYQFEVDKDALHGALDRFAQFFIAPLFTETATEREINAVDSENSKNRLNDAWRRQQLMRNMAKPESPVHSFGTGNKQTLSVDPKEAGIEVRQALLDFHAKYYSANRMRQSQIYEVIT